MGIGLIARNEMTLSIDHLWHQGMRGDWHGALERYWDFVLPRNVELEKELEQIPLEFLRGLDAQGWYDFLRQEYFRWKYTAPNRYATTTAHLAKHCSPAGMEALERVRLGLLVHDPKDIAGGLRLVCQIKGLGTAGASGLLALVFPRHYGTVDQFAVEALRQVDGLPEAATLARMNPMGLTEKDAVVLIGIMQRKAAELTREFGEDWTPRMVDKVLWTIGHPPR